MSNISPSDKLTRGAGILALAWREVNVSPHHILLNKEKAFFTEVLKGSLIGLRDLTERSAAVIAAFDNLQAVLQEGRLFFLNGDTAASDKLDKTFALRIASYEMGRATGFDKVIRMVRRKLHPTEHIGGESFQKEEFEAALTSSLALEEKRVAAVHRISTALNECLSRLAKDKNLLFAVCALTKCDDHETFLRARREDIQASTKNLFEWLQRSDTVHASFCASFQLEGWFTRFHRFGALFGPTPESDIQLSKPITSLISPSRRAAIAYGVSAGLDVIAHLAREHTTFPESPIKDVYRINFLLGELEKPLPTDLAESHQKQLAIVTKRFIQAPDALVLTVGLEQDERFAPQERARFLEHIKAELDRLDAPTSPEISAPSAPDFKRSEIRRERREELQLEKEEEAKKQLLQRILDIKESSPTTTRVKAQNTITFFPTRLEQELLAWTETLPEHVRDGVRGLLESAARGDRVDSKPINIEKKIFELRLIGCGYRIYCTRSKNNELVVLGFGPKESQKQDILTAHGRFRHFCALSEPA